MSFVNVHFQIKKLLLFINIYIVLLNFSIKNRDFMTFLFCLNVRIQCKIRWSDKCANEMKDEVEFGTEWDPRTF